jgi:hypothetical protein
MKKKNLFCSIILILFLFALFSCNSAKRNWEKALQQNTVTGFREYLQKYPESEFAGIAAQKFDSLDWVQTLAGMDSIKMAQYLENHLKGSHVEEARILLDSLQWEKACALKDTSRIKNLLIKNPLSKFREKGEAIIWEVEWPPVKFARKGSVTISSKKYGGLGIISGTMYQSSLFFGAMDQMSGARDIKGMIITENGLKKICDEYPIPGLPAIFIWREFISENAETARKLGIQKGVAYLIGCDGKILHIRKVDLNKSDDQLCADFGIVVH